MTPLSREAAAAAGEVPRVAIEAPRPSVDGGRFPARLVVGSSVPSDRADILTDGHDKPGVAMALAGAGGGGHLGRGGDAAAGQ